ncbi:MAG: hypothetical protein ABF649_14395 [Bacillus sp. (in: firmicutes)]
MIELCFCYWLLIFIIGIYRLFLYAQKNSKNNYYFLGGWIYFGFPKKDNALSMSPQSEYTSLSMGRAASLLGVNSCGISPVPQFP